MTKWFPRLWSVLHIAEKGMNSSSCSSVQQQLVNKGTIAVGLVLGLWLYNYGRTTSEWVGLDPASIGTGLMLLCIPVLVAAACIACVRRPGKILSTILGALLIRFVCSLLIGAVGSELWILRDEVRFKHEL